MDDKVGSQAPGDARAVEELIAEQRRRIHEYVGLREQQASGPGTGEVPEQDAAGMPPCEAKELFDAMPVPGLLIEPVLAADGTLDFLYAGQNAACRRYAAAVAPEWESWSQPWPGRVRLFDLFPSMENSRVPRLLADAYRTGRPQGPVSGEWFVHAPNGPVVRISNEVRAARCGGHLLLTWERGHRETLTRAAQRMAQVCWAEWNLGDSAVLGSYGMQQVLGLGPVAPVPGLPDLAAMTDPGDRGTLYEVLTDVIVRGRSAECELTLTRVPARIVRFSAEPVRLQGGPVWGVRGVIMDITRGRRSRERAQHAEQEAHSERERTRGLTDVAVTLRDAVVPRFANELAPLGLDTAAVYCPDPEAAGVGGDWFKARVLPSGRALLAIGDARGHGLEAVTLMAKLRYALAGLAYTDEPVEKLTAWLNHVACDDGPESTATAIVARFHPATSLLRWVCAGHPRPVLVRGGSARLLSYPPDGPGLPLGVVPGATYTATETTLSPGDVVLMYTDGLVERRGSDLDTDMARLLRVAERLARGGITAGHDGLERYGQAVAQDMAGAHQTDDATLLLVRRLRVPTSPPGGPEH
ncbi:serine/threonine-protein phosphatase [Streptomyces sp. NBC_00056]|uniref:PP2C family protein-serine/threonine phosphatase n=1 Tax=unclassified Streptomyces TaxID=2593676 RepID=UPI00224E5C83|nr:MULTISPECIES: PP2C family protein-serine/threonine phosphatase [unclassified Streptomyces]MCX5441828.1 serine/threonine-protein phosphatase [Streptomyces sp. NBC_00063]WUB91905.1 serine/threonine-protein phosphatase [Streptomyces sp. NBC_00569]